MIYKFPNLYRQMSYGIFYSTNLLNQRKENLHTNYAFLLDKILSLINIIIIQ